MCGCYYIIKEYICKFEFLRIINIFFLLKLCVESYSNINLVISEWSGSIGKRK